MKDTMNLLKGSSGDRYLEYVKVMSLHNNVRELNIIPSSTQKLYLKGSQQQQ